MSGLPDELEVEGRLARVRAEVLEATHHVRSPKRSTRFRVTRNIAIGGVAIAALSAGTIIVANESAETIDAFVYCYEVADLGGDRADAILPAAADPALVCGEFWRVGRLGQEGRIDPNDPNNDFPVPDLVACEGRDGVAAVFPRNDAETNDQGLCEALGLAAWDSD
jgi:hypothetical protein